MITFWNSYKRLVELFVSYLVHLLCGFYFLGSSFAGDLSHCLWDYVHFGNKPNKKVKVKEKASKAHRETKAGSDLPPIVWVHGFFGFGPLGKRRLGSLSNFGGGEKNDQRVIVPDLGSLTSVYDRARELFYYLKGGQVDYGAEHSKACGHSQFGRIYEGGQYDEWDEDHPIHLVGHSGGAQVVRVLQQMLADKAFKGHQNTSDKWVLSITSLSGALNGTTRSYIDGMQDGRRLKAISLVQLRRIGVIIYEWLDIPWVKKHTNFGLDHFNMSWNKIGGWGLVKCLIGNSGPFASGDWILPDLTIEGSIRLNTHIRTFPNTYYFSYATKRTWKLMGFTLHSTMAKIHPMLFLRVLQITLWSYPPHLSPPYKGYRDEEWQENDGSVNTISMTHPRFPIEHPSCLLDKDSDFQLLQPGIWNYKLVEGHHIPFIVDRGRAGAPFDSIYDTIFERCRKHVPTSTA